jgi:hypothetical protein
MSNPVIAVIGGTGAEGSGLVVRWAAAGYPVIIGSRSADKAQTVATELAALLPAGSGEIRGESNADAARLRSWCWCTLRKSGRHGRTDGGRRAAGYHVVVLPAAQGVRGVAPAAAPPAELQQQLGEQVQVAGSRTLPPAICATSPGRQIVMCSTPATARKPKPRRWS